MSQENTIYSELINKDFVFELAKRGAVQVLSNQIKITCEKNCGDLDGIVIPQHTHLQGLYAKKGAYDNQETATLIFVCEKRTT